MILITSAAYVNSEFQTEFGRLPPSFLPVGNRRLFEYQLEFLKKNLSSQQVLISLPSNFSISIKDAIYLEKCNVRILRSDDNLSLGSAVSKALEISGVSGEALYLLHGDTLIEDIPASTDIIGIVKTDKDYKWEVESAASGFEAVWCGFFSFSSVDNFRSLLKESNNNFIEAVRSYATQFSVQNVWINGWHDFGHVNTYFLSRSKLTTQRSFNSLNIDEGCVKKMGHPFEKIRAEAIWFGNLPSGLKRFCPQLVESGDDEFGRAYYVTEYLPIPPLNEVFVHGKNPIFYWDKIFSLCSKFLLACSGYDEITNTNLESNNYLLGNKTWQRLEVFCNQSDYPGIDGLNVINGREIKSIRCIVQDCLARISNSDAVKGILHGDFCFSNILFDSRLDNIKVVDPRGLNEGGEITSYGDLRYDLAKLTHSVIGLYDFILAGAFDLDYVLNEDQSNFNLLIHTDERIKAIQEVYMARFFWGNTSPKSTIPLTVLLFLSMLPLHSDDRKRQLALLANAMRLYSEFLA